MKTSSSINSSLFRSSRIRHEFSETYFLETILVLPFTVLLCSYQEGVLLSVGCFFYIYISALQLNPNWGNCLHPCVTPVTEYRYTYH